MSSIRKVSVASLAIAFGVINFLYAQPSELPKKRIRLEHITESLSLSQGSINCILQDRDGYLWIGTWSGLIRYNGYSTTSFQAENKPGKLKSNKIASLYEDRHGSLWIGTYEEGLFQYKKETNEFIQFIHDPSKPGSLVNDDVHAIQEDRHGNLWIGTEDGISVKHPDSVSFYNYHHEASAPSSIGSNVISALFLSSTGTMWIATGQGLSEVTPQQDLSRNRFRTYIFDTADGLSFGPHNYVYQVAEFVNDNKISIWFTTKSGLKTIRNGVIENYVVKTERASSYNLFLTILTGQYEKPYFLVGSEEGLNFFDPIAKKFTRFLSNKDSDLSLSHNSITALYMDKGGVLWVGTKKGLDKFDTYLNDFDAYKTIEFDRSNSIITGLQESLDHGYWISTLGGGLFKYVNGVFTSYSLGQDKLDFAQYIQTLFVDSNRNVWVGTAGQGIYCFKETDVSRSGTVISKYRHFDENSIPRISDDYVMSFMQDKQGNVWAGTWGHGLNKFSHDFSIQYLENEALRKPLVTLYVDHVGALWAGTRGNGVYCLDPQDTNPDHLRHYDHRAGLSNNFVNTITETGKGQLLIGTDGGLNTFDRKSGSFGQFSFPEQASNVVISVLEDNLNKLWVSNWSGLMTCSTDAPNYVKVYDKHDNIMGGFFYSNVCLKDSQGRLLFGGSEGFNIIEPTRLTQNPIEPKAHFENFSIANQQINAGDQFGGRTILNASINDVTSLELKHDENSISFEFATNDFASPDKISYAFMLSGFDQDWTYTSAARRYANYTNLNPGHYTFKVRASNIDGAWNKNIKVISIVIEQPWWQTIWARALYVAFGLLLLYGLRSFIVFRTNLLHNLKLEKVQRENMEKLNKVKLQFFTNISHELRTPLTLIIGPIQTMLAEIDVKNKFHQQLQIVNQNSQRLLRLVNQLLDFRKVETENARPRVSEGNIVQFMNDVKKSFDPLADKMNILFAIQSSLTTQLLWFDADMCEKIFFNLLSNAFKHTPENGEITIILEDRNDCISISIRDNGTGIKKKYLDNLFQTFFSFDEDRTHASSGIGLALVKGLVNLHHGTVDVESEENLFTKFIVTFRKGFDHFSLEERAPREDQLVSDISELPVYDSHKEEQKYEQSSDDVKRNKILVIEDNIDVSDYIRTIFARDFIVLQAANGKEGLNKAREFVPDIIISDIMMPEMDGISFCRTLKADIKTSHIPIILLTARGSMELRMEGLESGADEYVTKPFTPKVLELNVKNLIRTRKALQTFYQSHGTLSLEPKRISLNSPDEQFLKTALLSVENNISDPEYTVETLCRDVGMSYTQLYRKIKALTGQTVNEFIKNIRLKRAAQLLEQNQLTVAEITYKVGFTDLQHFRECFKKLFGVTPSHYPQQDIKNAS